ncbi:MAG: hypothetical protein ACYC6O_05420 [Thermoleophilia bacterium]
MTSLSRSVWVGAAAATAVSLVSGVILFIVAGEAGEEAGEVFEILVAILKSLFGYDASPSIAQMAGYLSYLAVMMWFFLRPARAFNPARQASKNAA